MEKTAIKFSNKVMPLDMRFDIQAPKQLGVTAKVFMHEQARKLPLYRQSIEYDIEGQDKEGKKIIINSVGRWLFGVPSYDGHIRIVADGNQVSLYYPKESPQVVHDLINLLKESIETKQ